MATDVKFREKCLMCECELTESSKPIWKQTKGFCGSNCQGWYQEWFQFHPDRRPKKMAFYLVKKYSR